MLQISVPVALRVKRSDLALVAVACGYVGVGYLVFLLASALTGDGEVANAIAAFSSVPLSVLLFYVMGRIDKRR